MHVDSEFPEMTGQWYTQRSALIQRLQARDAAVYIQRTYNDLCPRELPRCLPFPSRGTKTLAVLSKST